MIKFTKSRKNAAPFFSNQWLFFSTLLAAIKTAGLTEAVRGSLCPAKFPHTVANADGGLEEGKICWKDTAAKDKSCDGWCLKPEFAAADPGGHLAACNRNEGIQRTHKENKEKLATSLGNVVEPGKNNLLENDKMLAKAPEKHAAEITRIEKNA